MWQVSSIDADGKRVPIDFFDTPDGQVFRSQALGRMLADMRTGREHLIELFEQQAQRETSDDGADTAFDAIETWAAQAAEDAARLDWTGVPPLRAVDEAIARYEKGAACDAPPQCVAWHDTAGVLIPLPGDGTTVEIAYTPDRESERSKQRLLFRHATPQHRLETILEWRAFVGEHSAIIDGWTLMRESGRGHVASLAGATGFVVATVLRRLTRAEPTLTHDPRATSRRLELEDRYPLLADACPSLHEIDRVEHPSAMVFVHGTASCGLLGLKDLFGPSVDGHAPPGPVYRFEHDTFLPVVDNSRELAALLLERVHAERLLLVAHSRGGLVAADAAQLLQSGGYRGAISVQTFGTPFAGTPLVAIGKRALNLMMKLGEEIATNVPVPMMSPLAKALFYVLESPTLPPGIMAMKEDAESLPFLQRAANAAALTSWGSDFDIRRGSAGFGTLGDAALLGALQGQAHDMVVPVRSAQAGGTPAAATLACAHGHYFREKLVRDAIDGWLTPPARIVLARRVRLKSAPPAAGPAPSRGIAAPPTASFNKRR
jgi:pimeloyl-ACP methyl ester carboxylesterase